MTSKGRESKWFSKSKKSYYPISAECVSKEGLDKVEWLREFHKDWILDLRYS